LVFSDASFVFLFLPLALTAGLLLRRVAFAQTILVLSLVFYFWTAASQTWILVLTILLNYAGGRILELQPQKLILAGFVAANLSLLAYFKYAVFAAYNIDVATAAHFSELVKGVVLPIGISFFTFQGISYVIDVYRRHVHAERNLIIYGAYKSFFPQLIAGPIVRFRDVVEYFHHPKVGIDIFSAGAARFAHGLLKKVLIVDNDALIVNAIFNLPAGATGFATAWLGAFAFAVQIYFDFSGYSDMAIGLGQMFGVRILENFNRPYSSYSITEFWRRWHISLSSWFRDYLYIPLGGNRQGTLATYRNLFVVFFLTGLWHGAAWTYIVWGLYHGAFLVLERMIFRDRPHLWQSQGFRFFYCLPIVLIGWMIFRATNLDQATSLISAMFSPTTAGAFDFPDLVVSACAPINLLALAAGAMIFLLPGGCPLSRRLSRTDLALGAQVASLSYATGALIVAGIFVLSHNFSPFLYFQF
jgi:alginate O-acetyltransferase complex protein AlgI